MLETIEEIVRDIFQKLHNNIPVPEFMSLQGISESGKSSLEWQFLAFRLSGTVRDRTLMVNKIGMTKPMLDLFLDEIASRTPMSELPMRYLAFDVSTDAFARDLFAHRGLTRYEIGNRIYYWREVTGQLALF